MTPPDSDETIEVLAGSNGDLFYLIDPATKMVYADIDEAVLGSRTRDPRRVLLHEFVAKEPLAEDLKAHKIELEDKTKVGNETCYRVHITRSEPPEVIWYLSTKDLLPRRIDRLYKNPEGKVGSTQLALTDLVAEPTCNTALFELTVPQGFTQTDEFAP